MEDELAQHEEQRIVAMGFHREHRADGGIGGRQHVDEPRNGLGRVLQIGVEHGDPPSSRFPQPRLRGAKLPRVRRQTERAYPTVAGERGEQPRRAVGAGIIDQHDFERPVALFSRSRAARYELGQDPRFVVHRRHDAQRRRLHILTRRGRPGARHPRCGRGPPDPSGCAAAGREWPLPPRQ